MCVIKFYTMTYRYLSIPWHEKICVPSATFQGCHISFLYAFIMLYFWYSISPVLPEYGWRNVSPSTRPSVTKLRSTERAKLGILRLFWAFSKLFRKILGPFGLFSGFNISMEPWKPTLTISKFGPKSIPLLTQILKNGFPLWQIFLFNSGNIVGM